MPASYVAQGGTFKKIKTMHRYSTSQGWRKVKAAWIYTAGAWAKVFTSGATVAKGANCVLLLHGEDFTDDSWTPKTGITTAGSTTIEADCKFGEGSMRFAGTGSSVRVPYSNDFLFGTGDFTIDFWLKRNGSQANGGGPFTTGPAGLGYTKMFWSTNRLQVEVGSVGLAPVTATTVPDLTWTHVALVRSGTTLRLFLNGTVATFGSISAGVSAGATGFWLGSADIGGTAGLNGWIDEFRIQKGVAQWTAAFVPPLYPYGEEDVAPDPVSFRYVNWYITETATTLIAAAQASEFRMLLNGTPVATTPTVTQFGGFSGSSAEDFTKLATGILTDKWCDTGFNARGFANLIFDYGSPISFNGYQYATANDEVGRDPRDWLLQGSNDGINWTLLHAVSGYSSTSSRQTWNPPVAIPLE
jgi:hypothetical protein